jgi:hypothetical protein
VISDSALLGSFMAYSPTFAGGVRVAAGDVDLIGGLGVPFHDEVITGPGATGGPHVKVFNGSGTFWTGGIASFFAFSPTFTGGVFVAAGDVNGDGRDDIIVGAGAQQSQAEVEVFNAADGGVLLTLNPFSTSFNGGERVGVTDVNGTGQTDIVVAGGAGQPSTVLAFNTTTNAQVSSYTAFDPSFLGGVFVGGIL